MIFKKPKAADPVDDLLKKAAQSDDTILRERATQYMIDMVAERCSTPADLYQFLQAIPDTEQRFLVLDRLKPLLPFSTADMVFEDQAPKETIQ